MAPAVYLELRLASPDAGRCDLFPAGPCARAGIAAQSAALPEPTTMTSHSLAFHYPCGTPALIWKPIEGRESTRQAHSPIVGRDPHCIQGNAARSAGVTQGP